MEEPHITTLVKEHLLVNGETTWIQNLADLYEDTLIKKSNPVVMSWPMVSNDQLNFTIIFFYVMFVTKLGPKLMRNRSPFDLRWLMVPYNVALVITNFYLFTQFVKARWAGGNVDTSCVTLDFTENPNAYRLAEVTWWYYMTKYIELSDTVFFVLRKKDNQLSNLHLIHHSSVPIICWGMLRSEPGGYNSFFPLANSFVHCVMYTYYAISALGDEVQIHLWFKKYVTMTQMAQFILVLVYFFSRPFTLCQPTKLAFSFNVFIAGFFFVLFSNFYWNEYCKSKEEESAKNGVNSNSKTVKCH